VALIAYFILTQMKLYSFNEKIDIKMVKVSERHELINSIKFWVSFRRRFSIKYQYSSL